MSSPTPTNRRTSSQPKATRSRPRRQHDDAFAEVQPLPTCDRLWSTAELAEFLGLPVMTLWEWRQTRKGPKAFKVGKHLRYDPDEVRRWLVEECSTEATA